MRYNNNSYYIGIGLNIEQNNYSNSDYDKCEKSDYSNLEFYPKNESSSPHTDKKNQQGYLININGNIPYNKKKIERSYDKEPSKDSKDPKNIKYPCFGQSIKVSSKDTTKKPIKKISPNASYSIGSPLPFNFKDQATENFERKSIGSHSKNQTYIVNNMAKLDLDNISSCSNSNHDWPGILHGES